MSTWLRLLTLTFWMLPVQRVATVVGLGVLMFLGAALLAGTSYGYDVSAFGSLAAFGIPALFGGAFWRALSASRATQLAPAGRLRLLGAAVGMAATVALIWVAWQALFDLGVAPRWRTDLAGLRQLFVGVFAGATWWGVASFIASRSPLAMLVVLVWTFATAWLWDRYASTTILLTQLWWQPWSIALPLTLWAAFGTWYLRARRIRPPGWLLPGSQSVIAAVAMAETANSGVSRRVALERLLLGGTSVLRLLAQWLLVAGMLLVILLLLGRQGEQESRSVAHMSFAALILCPVIVAALARAVVRRARVLWLPSGFSRGELFACTEAALLKLTLGMALLFATFLLVLWFTQPWRPATTLPLMLGGLFASTLLFTMPVLCRLESRKPWQTVAVVVVLVPIVVRSFVNPLLAQTPVGTWWSPAIGLIAILALRELARRRWLAEDLPRVPGQAAS